MNARLYARRRYTNGILLTLSVAAAIFGIAWLAIILGELVLNGITDFSPKLFTEMTPPPGEAGGLANAIMGSVLMGALAVGVGAPIGIMAGTYLAEYGKHSRLAAVIRFINDILLSTPSILIGLFIYEVIVLPTRQFSGLAGAAALAVIVIPVVVRITENMLRLVPNGLREAASALGAAPSSVIWSVTWRAARAGIITGVLLSVSRISGETAPLIFTAFGNPNWAGISDMARPMASLPKVIFDYANQPDQASHELAWAGALLITIAVLTLSILARVIERKRS